MIRQLLFAFTILVISIAGLSAQVPLASFIGLNNLPSDADSICEIPIYPEVSTNLEGPLEGELVHDFKLYTLEGDSVLLSGLMNDTKPVLLVGCNYTCYVFRGKIDVLNEINSIYGDLINIYLVYTVEAHPVIDFSPYFGYENVGAENYADGILYRQPLTYGERKEIVSDMLANETIDVPVLIDGPCNEFWMQYGTAPNPAWLIAPDGIVYDAQKWFNKAPDNMYASIDSILNLVGTGVYVPEGQFSAADEGEEIYYGTVDNTIAAHITLTNTSTDDVLIDFIRTDEDVPAGWFTAMCTDLCYSPGVDSTTVYLTAGATEIVRVDFFTDLIPASGMVEIKCVNHYDPLNEYTFTLHAQSIAEPDAIITTYSELAGLYPNPVMAGRELFLNYLPESEEAEYQLLNATGAVVVRGSIEMQPVTEISIGDLTPGMYLFLIRDKDQQYAQTLVVLNK